MRIYLDNCCFNRPFDDQRPPRIRLETEAKLEVQQRIKAGSLELAWSYMLDHENLANPFEERQAAISRWRRVAAVDVEESASILDRARSILDCGLRPKDAIHLACALEAGCSCLLTTDDLFVRKARGVAGIAVLNPTQFVIEAEQ